MSYISNYCYSKDYNELVDINKHMFDSKKIYPSKNDKGEDCIRGLYIFFTEKEGDNEKGDNEISAFLEGYETKLPVKIGLCSILVHNGGVEFEDCLKAAKGRGNGTGYAEKMRIFFVYPFNRFYINPIDQKIIKYIEIIHKNNGFDIKCSYNEKKSDDLTLINSGKEFIKYGLRCNILMATLSIVEYIESDYCNDDIYDIINEKYPNIKLNKEHLYLFCNEFRNIINEIDSAVEESNSAVEESNLIIKVDSDKKGKNECVDKCNIININEEDIGQDDSMLIPEIFKNIPWTTDIKKIFIWSSINDKLVNKNKSRQYIKNIISLLNIDRIDMFELSKYNTKNDFGDNTQLVQQNTCNVKNMKIDNFDLAILNPPYKKDLYKCVLRETISNMSGNAKLIFICPASFLNDQRYGKDDENNKLRKLIEPYVKKIIIENFNNEFGVRQNHPFAVIYIDKKKIGSGIEFICNGEKPIIVYDINDCNINNCNILQSFKIQKDIQLKISINSLDTMNNHMIVMSNENNNETQLLEHNNKIYYVRVGDILSTPVSNSNMNKSKNYINGIFYSYHESCVHHEHYVDNKSEPYTYEKVMKKIKDDGIKRCYLLKGTKNEMQNWIYNIANCKLLIALNIIMFYDQHNQSKKIVPWLVDKKYTDDELYRMFDINEQEKEYIEKLLNQYNIDSSWWQHYISGQKENFLI